MEQPLDLDFRKAEYKFAMTGEWDDE
jgi:hypothetical protein